MELVFEGRGFGFGCIILLLSGLPVRWSHSHGHGTPCQEVFAYATTKPVTNVLAKHI